GRAGRRRDGSRVEAELGEDGVDAFTRVRRALAERESGDVGELESVPPGVRGRELLGEFGAGEQRPAVDPVEPAGPAGYVGRLEQVHAHDPRVVALLEAAVADRLAVALDAEGWQRLDDVVDRTLHGPAYRPVALGLVGREAGLT